MYLFNKVVLLTCNYTCFSVDSDLPVNLLSALNDQIMSTPMQSILVNLSYHIVMLETAALYPQLSPLVCVNKNCINAWCRPEYECISSKVVLEVRCTFHNQNFILEQYIVQFLFEKLDSLGDKF